MKILVKWIFTVTAFALICACSSSGSKTVVEKKTTETKKTETKTDYAKVLNEGIEFYKNRTFEKAKSKFQDILAGKASKDQLISSHKYLAFIFAIEKNFSESKNQFAAAFTLDKNFELEKSEMGNPVWTPAFEDAKKELTLTLMTGQECINQGKQFYTDRNYTESVKYFNMALERKDLSKENQILANKFTAFIFSIQKHPDKAKKSFRKAFELNKQFELEKSEYGNPVWTPLYDEIKKEFQK